MSAPACDISTHYLGLDLCSPLIPSASPLGGTTEALVEMENCGAGAVVLPSLFEQPYERHPFHPDYYFEKIVAAKAALKIPVIASLNASTPEGWAKLATEIEKAGADALELNIYHLSLDSDLPSARIEQAYIDVVKTVTETVKIPVAVKLPPFFTNLALLGRELTEAGASGWCFSIVFINRMWTCCRWGPGIRCD